MLKMVNGFPCTSGCDERLAKKGVDPRNPHQDPVKQEQLDARSPQAAAKAANGAAEDKRVDGVRPVDPVTGLPADGSTAARSATAPGVGQVLDILA